MREAAMATRRQVEETVARCVSLMVCYRNSRGSPRAGALMAADARAVAGWAKENIAGGDVDGDILRPVRAELVARYGPVAGAGLYGVFVRAFAAGTAAAADGVPIAARPFVVG
jgi:hypothetical protein